MARRSPQLDEWRGQVSADLGNIKEKLDAAVERIEKAFSDRGVLDREAQIALQERVAKVEKQHSNLVGKLTVYGIIIMAIVSALVHKFIG